MSNIETLRSYHIDAQKRLNFYADDADMRKSDSEHYHKRAKFHAEMVEVIDALTLQAQEKQT